MKSFTGQTKTQLEALFKELNIDLPDHKYTKLDLVFVLEEMGLNHKNIENFNKKKEKENKDYSAYESMVVICMDRKNASYKFKRYKFTQQNKYMLMSKEDANELIANSSGFHLATPDEIRNYFKK